MAAQQVAILGLGLIGSSIGLGLKQLPQPPQIVGFDPSQATLQQALRRGAIDRAAPSARDTAREADTVVLAAPVRGILQLLAELGGLLGPDTLVTDTGSTKVGIVQEAERVLAEGAGFVGGHPLAGRLRAGVNDADARLFAGSVYCLSPTPSTPSWAVERATEFVENLGATPYFLDATEHDGLLAAISHLPYFASVALADAVGGQSAWSEMGVLAAGGFRAATSLVDASPEMWTDIALTNREPLARQIDEYAARLAELRELITAGDAEKLAALLQRVQARHRQWLESRGEAPPAPAARPAPRWRLPFFR